MLNFAYREYWGNLKLTFNNWGFDSTNIALVIYILPGAPAGPQGAEVGGNAGEGGVAEQEVERDGGASRLAGGYTRPLST